ncbi:MAG TPA: GntG family PLP-dependent aldolase [Chitinophagaceae bacterium]|nr:GntG family PLP-dependent aldolase [Chitinophagaceae bacterium]
MKADFRSDTVTRPTAAMLDYMMKAPVGDDVFSEDPSINHLEHLSADIFGYEAAIFCPSGTMTNQIAIKCHTSPGDEVICEKNSHIYIYEGGGIAFNSGASVRLIDGDRGRVSSEQVAESINPDDVHRPVSRMVGLENTCNRGGGSCYDLKQIEKIKEVCNRHNLILHLDGARLFNALVAKNEDPKEYGRLFDSISICLSKSLGAPVGSVLLGNSAMIKKARRIRKVFGGGMRQAGYLAAAGIYALENNVARLSQDHLHARMIEEALRGKSFIDTILPVETNIIIASFHQPYTPQHFIQAMEKEDILLFAISPTQIRMVLHLDITPAMVEKTINAIKNL